MENIHTVTAVQTRQNFMDAFWQLYCKKNIEKITVKEVCSLAGYNRTTFYAYFQDIYEVLDEIEKNIITADEFEDKVLKNILLGKSEKEIIEKVLELYHDNNEYLSVLLGEHGDPGFREKIIKRILPKLTKYLPNLSTKEFLRLKYLMEYQSAAALNTITKWHRDQDVPMDEFVEILVCLTTNGVKGELLGYFKKRIPTKK